MKHYFSILFLLFFVCVNAQVDYSEIDSKMMQIANIQTKTTTDIANFVTTNFSSEEQKIRAIFFWTATNISYDIANLGKPTTDTREQKISKTLATHKGVCMHYAEVFSDIANKVGIKTFVIDGVTKQNGVVAPLGHSWCASKIDGKWCLFDPTWGAGFVNNNIYYPKLNNYFFKIEANEMIKTHIPFDYMWQLLAEPISNQEFNDGIVLENKPLKNYNYNSEIENYFLLSETEKTIQSAQRIKENGLISNLITERYTIMQKNLVVSDEIKNIEKIKILISNYNATIKQLNGFIMYRNAKFKPALSDADLLNKIEIPLLNFRQIQEQLNQIGDVGNANNLMVSKLKNQISKSIQITENQEVFVKDFLTKDAEGRKNTFAPKVKKRK